MSKKTGYMEQDALGSITSMTNSSGALSDTWSYGDNGWGEPLHTSGTTAFYLRFTARDYDGSSNLDYNRARWYDPVTGRFISEDPIRFRAGDNFYSYALNNPIMRTDPQGLQTKPNPCSNNLVCDKPDVSLFLCLSRCKGEAHAYYIFFALSKCGTLPEYQRWMCMEQIAEEARGIGYHCEVQCLEHFQQRTGCDMTDVIDFIEEQTGESDDGQ